MYGAIKQIHKEVEGLSLIVIGILVSFLPDCVIRQLHDEDHMILEYIMNHVNTLHSVTVTERIASGYAKYCTQYASNTKETNQHLVIAMYQQWRLAIKQAAVALTNEHKPQLSHTEL